MMAWNPSRKSVSQDIQTTDLAPKRQTGANTKVVSPGAPIAYTHKTPEEGYKDGWDIEAAYREGVASITWSWRAIDVIASNQSRLPMVARKNNSPFGAVVNDEALLKVLNIRANQGETGQQFRYRVSAQLLMSTRGVFIEVIRSKRTGDPIALNLLPPQYTSAVPDPKKFVSHYVLDMPEKEKVKLDRNSVIWLRRPHPLDPYLSLTPLESCGVAIEIEMLAKIYNRNFLINDGRPGGLLVLRSEVDDDDKFELQSRFAGNINRAGAVSVVSSENGADFVDTASNPRDAAYVQMRQLTKEEILAAFGVPESIIGNASGRTFANASEEGKVFWMETMLPHLDMISQGLDRLDPELYVGHDTSSVPILILAQQERDAFAMQEYSTGLITANEYRETTGREPVESDLADSMLANPNLTPIGNTERAMPAVESPAAQAQGGVPLDVQASEATQTAATEFNPESGQFDSPTEDQSDITQTGSMDIEVPASEAPSDLAPSERGEGRKTLPLLRDTE